MGRISRWLSEIRSPNREKMKTECVDALFRNIVDHPDTWTPKEQVEILSRLSLRVFESQKIHRDRLVKEARLYQDSLKEIKL